MKKTTITSWALASAMLLSTGLSVAQDSTATDDFFDFSLEDLMNVEVTSASKSAERLQDVTSSLYVITSDDIERSGATRITDVLQMVPGLFVVHNNYNNAELGMRDRADAFVGGALVLIDNVPYLSPFTSTMDFENFDINLDMIDRIEVIKGSGGTIYGANSATGVINIFTKDPSDFQGVRVSMNSGTRGYVSPNISYGTTIGDGLNINAYYKGNFFNGFAPMDAFNGTLVTVPQSVTETAFITIPGLGTIPAYTYVNGGSGSDTTIENNYQDDVYRTEKNSGGFNISTQISDATKFSSNFLFTQHAFQRYVSEGGGQTFALTTYNNKRYVGSSRIDHDFNENHSLFIQAFVNNEVLLNSTSESKYSTFNVEIQDNLKTGIHNLNFGANFRQVGFQVGPFDDASGIAFANPNSTEYLGGAFIQDKMTFGNKFDVLAGIKGEIWSLIDNKPEWSPSLRFAYRPNEKLTIWGAGSRSVTTPGFIQTNIDVTFAEAIPGILPYRLAIVNGPNTDQSEYWTYEIGAKGGGTNFTYEVSGFYVDANKLIGTVTDATPTASPVNANDTVTPIYYANVLNTTNMGVEALFRYKPSKMLSFEFSYAMIQIDYEDGEHPVTGAVVENSTPDVPEIPMHVLRARAYIDFKRDLRLSINSSFWTQTGTNEFIYDEQRVANAATAGEVGLTIDEPTERFRLDFKFEKRFADGKSSAYIWGTDIFNSGYVQNYQVYATGIPYQIHGLYGVGMQYDF